MPEMNDDQLRILFREAGPAQAPAGLRPAVMARLREVESLAPTAPLLNGRQWTLAICVLIGVVALASLLGSPNEHWLVPSFPITIGPWIAGTLAAHPWIPAASCLVFLWVLWEHRTFRHHAA